MAQSSQQHLEQKQELVLKLDASRKRITEGPAEIGRRLRPDRLVSSYLKRHPLLAFGATSVGVAALTYILFPRPKAAGKHPSQSLIQSVLGWIPSFLKGSIRRWILRQVRDYLLTKRP